MLSGRLGETRGNLSAADAGKRLLDAYPTFIRSADDTNLHWHDGTSMPLDDAAQEKSFNDWLQRPSLRDMFRFPYAAGSEPKPPSDGHDPGRARNSAFFTKMYGDCSKGEVTAKLVAVAWLPKRYGKPLYITRINGVAEKLSAVSKELDELPPALTKFLIPPAGTYVCRSIAGTDQASAHGYGIAIDLSVRHAHYWRWSNPGATGQPVWRNDIPSLIVRIFERHGFIWGGRWSHFDTMHFEYRPELLAPP